MEKLPTLVLYTGSRLHGTSLKNKFQDIFPMYTLTADDANTRFKKVFVFFEYVGNNVQTMDLLAQMLDSASVDEFFITIDDCYEGLIDDDFLIRFKELLDNQPRVTDYRILSSNKILDKKIEKHLGDSSKFLYHNIHLYLAEYDGIYPEYLDYKPLDHLRDKKFLCVNRQERVHRLRTVDFLIKEGIDKHTFLSCTLGDYAPLLDDNKSFQRQNVHVERYQDPELEKIILSPDSKSRLKQTLPIDLDVHESQRKAMSTNMPNLFQYFTESYWSIITEGDFSSKKDIRQFTEKVLKCFAFYHPFVVIGLPGTLELLREQGFITFNSIIDESYDTELNDDKRLNMVLKEIKKLNELNIQEMKRLYNDIMPILEHNYKTYKNIFDKNEPAQLINTMYEWYYQK